MATYHDPDAIARHCDQSAAARRIDAIAHVNHFAEREGWAIFNGVMIQRDDETELFPSDGAAMAHVLRMAWNGSALHQEALRLVGRDPAGERMGATQAARTVADAIECFQGARARLDEAKAERPTDDDEVDQATARLDAIAARLHAVGRLPRR